MESAKTTTSSIKSSDASPKGALYVVSTPIGNLGDLSQRAVETLKQVNLIAAEDTRHSRRLMQHYGIDTPLHAYHDHSDRSAQQKLIDHLLEGRSVALVSDAGTPLIADPGFKLVRNAREQGISVVTIPGACALIAALSISGLSTDRFSFEGFLPAKREQRLRTLEALAREPRTLVFYEAPHRLLDTLEAMREVFGGERQVAVARELTKKFETLLSGSLSKLVEQVRGDVNQQRGECVIVVERCVEAAEETAQEQEADRIIRAIYKECGPRQVAAVVTELTGLPKRTAYQRVVAIKGG